MGLCGSRFLFNGELEMSVQNYTFQDNQISGSINSSIGNYPDTIYVHVNIIGIEQYTFKGTQISKIILNEKLLAERQDGPQLQKPFQFNPLNNQNIQSNFSKVLEYQFSTLMYLECYFSKKQKANSNEAMKNTRRIIVMKAIKQQQAAVPINKQYQCNEAGFAPLIILKVDRNQFRIGDHLRGLMTVDNSRSNQSIISNTLTILQVIEIQHNQQYKRITPQVMHQQKLDNINSEKKQLIIDVAISESYMDAWSYNGGLYKIKYYLQVEIKWENNQNQVLSDEIFIIDSTH